MKTANLMAVAGIFCAVSLANAASTKICFGSKKNPDTQGVVMTAKITRKNVTLRTTKPSSSFDYNGTYPSYDSVVHGRDGHTYLEYKGENSDYQDVILVNEDLLEDETEGLIQIRARGEGFFNNVFICRDDDGRIR